GPTASVALRRFAARLGGITNRSLAGVVGIGGQWFSNSTRKRQTADGRPPREAKAACRFPHLGECRRGAGKCPLLRWVASSLGVRQVTACKRLRAAIAALGSGPRQNAFVRSRSDRARSRGLPSTAGTESVPSRYARCDL